MYLKISSSEYNPIQNEKKDNHIINVFKIKKYKSYPRILQTHFLVNTGNLSGSTDE